MTPTLPASEDWARLAPAPGSPVWRAFNDPRMLLTAGLATLLQVAHPTVGHGVHQHSSFTADPWGRLLRTLDYVYGTIYGGPLLAGTIGARLRAMHRTITGRLPDGRRYSALEPRAFAWVHATLAAAIVRGHERLADPLTRQEREDFYEQWLDVGRLIGVRPQDLPQDYAGFERYFERMVAEELVWTPAVPEVLDTLSRPGAPNVPGLPPALWPVVRLPLALQLRVTTAGLLPTVLRERLGLPLTRSDAALFRASTAGARVLSPLIRLAPMDFGPGYVRWREHALAPGDATEPDIPGAATTHSRGVPGARG